MVAFSWSPNKQRLSLRWFIPLCPICHFVGDNQWFGVLDSPFFWHPMALFSSILSSIVSFLFTCMPHWGSKGQNSHFPKGQSQLELSRSIETWDCEHVVKHVTHRGLAKAMIALALTEILGISMYPWYVFAVSFSSDYIVDVNSPFLVFYCNLTSDKTVINVVWCCHCPFARKKWRVSSVSRTQFAVTSMQNYSDGPAAIETTTVASALQMRPLHAENLIGRAT